MSSDQPVAIISAGGSGIGLAIAQSLHALGYGLFVLDIDPHHVAEFQRVYGEGSATVCDVSDPQKVDSAFGAFRARHQRLDLLVKNAGIAGPQGALEDLAVDDWQRTIDTDLNSLFYMTRHAIPVMKAQRSGVIINMSSNAGLSGCPLRSPYAASKWAAIGLAKTWAMELGPWNIRVNALCPGSVSGPRIEGVIHRDAEARGLAPEDIRRVYQRQGSLRQFTDPEDIAAMVCFLAGPGGKQVSGQAIAIDGHTESLANWLDP
jgi:NAD(P)-dependent dehydrogenase (short-subunit alcohol dehydrogenase family)